MRILEGLAKDVRIKTALVGSGRPTSEETRSKAFEVLGTRILDAGFVDLFAGSGSVGIEALSRGAERAVFVENNRRLVRMIQTNLALCGFTEQARIIEFDAFETISTLNNRQLAYDIVFADPPIRPGAVETLVVRMDRYPIVTAKGVFVLRHSSDTEVSVTGLRCIQRQSSIELRDGMLSFFHRITR